jgi:DNA-binding FadR family transcriptional regulator
VAAPNLKVTPIRRRKLSEDVADRLQQIMLAGELVPGQQLPSERELMEMFQVGRSAVREALASLQRMGLLSIQSGERSSVTRPTASVLVNELTGAARHLLADPQGARWFQEARAVFETSVAARAAERATAADIRRLEEALEANRRALGDLPTFIETDIAFHLVLAEILRNPIFTALYAAIASWLKEQRTTSAEARGAAESAYRAHKRIFDAVARRDAAGAAEAMRLHLREVQRYYWKVKEASARERPRADAQAGT